MVLEQILLTSQEEEEEETYDAVEPLAKEEVTIMSARKRVRKPTFLFDEEMKQGREVPTGIVVRGTLRKKSPSLFMGWQRRHFQLEGRTLSYFKTTPEPLNRPKGIINFDNIQANVVSLHPREKFRFK